MSKVAWTLNLILKSAGVMDSLQDTLYQIYDGELFPSTIRFGIEKSQQKCETGATIHICPAKVL